MDLETRVRHGLMRTAACVVSVVARARYKGDERLSEAQGPLVVVCNHAARIDSLFLIHAAGERLAICGARPAYFGSWGLRQLMRTMDVMEVESEAQFLHDCSELLARGRVLLLYPEMRTNPSGLGEFRNWAAKLAIATGAPVLPCYLHGTTRDQPRSVCLTVGHRIEPEGAQDADDFTRVLRDQIVALSGGAAS